MISSAFESKYVFKYFDVAITPFSNSKIAKNITIIKHILLLLTLIPFVLSMIFKRSNKNVDI